MDQELFDAVQNNNIPRVRQILNQQGDLINRENGYEEIPLVVAIENGNLPMVNLLISYGADVNRHGVMSAAIRTNRIDIVDRLLQVGAEVVPGQGRMGPLELAVFYGLPEMTQFLLDQGADPFIKDDNGETLLHTVCFKQSKWITSDYRKTLLILLNYRDQYGRKLNIDALDDNGHPPLQVAINYDDFDFVKILLDHGADPNLINLEELTNNPEIRELIGYYSIEDVKGAIDY
jgi:ankyrin repeat protein